MVGSMCDLTPFQWLLTGMFLSFCIVAGVVLLATWFARGVLARLTAQGATAIGAAPFPTMPASETALQLQGDDVRPYPATKAQAEGAARAAAWLSSSTPAQLGDPPCRLCTRIRRMLSSGLSGRHRAPPRTRFL